LISWSSALDNNCRQLALNSPEALHKLYPEFSTHSKYFVDEDISLFKSPELGNYELIQTFPEHRKASPLPTEIRKLLNLPKKDIRYIGAYPPLP
jgi:hypothetical protein